MLKGDQRGRKKEAHHILWVFFMLSLFCAVLFARPMARCGTPVAPPRKKTTAKKWRAKNWLGGPVLSKKNRERERRKKALNKQGATLSQWHDNKKTPKIVILVDGRYQRRQGTKLEQEKTQQRQSDYMCCVHCGGQTPPHKRHCAPRKRPL
nr:hypothetical protein [Pandoravirus massiliensis]